MSEIRTETPKTQVKKLEETIQLFQIVIAFMLIAFVFIIVSMKVLYDSKNFWYENYNDYQSKYFKLLRESNGTCHASETNATDLESARDRIYQLELNAISDNSRITVCSAERDRDIAQFEFLILQEKLKNSETKQK